MTVIGTGRSESQWDVYCIRRPKGTADYDSADGIGRLRYLACNGSKSAALFLKDHYGSRKDPGQELKYACYAALAGDRDSYDRIKERGRNLEGFYPEDVVLRGPFERGRKYHGYLAVLQCLTAPLLEGKEPAYVPIEVLDRDLMLQCYPYTHTHPPYLSGSWPGYADTDTDTDGDPSSENRSGTDGPVGTCDAMNLPDAYDGLFDRDVFRYFGIGTTRDEDAAMRDLLRLAEGKHPTALDMIAYAIGYERDTMRIRKPADPTREASGHPMPYYVPDSARLGDCPEWNLLAMFTRTEPDGYCYDPAHENPDGGYEDDVLRIRPYDECRYGVPTFVFKPSGYSMAWYKHAWRDPVQSENLSTGEIRRVMRLCIEHIAYGREIPEGTTEELIAMPMHLFEPSEDFADLSKDDFAFILRRMAGKAPCNLIELENACDVQTFDYRNAEEAEGMALEIIRRMGSEGPLDEEGQMFKKVSIDEARATYQRLVDAHTDPDKKAYYRGLFEKAYGEDLYPDR